MELKIREYETLASTNDECKTLARAGEPEGTVVYAHEQTSGRGRAGHTFCSPRGGLYFSLLLRPALEDPTLITPAAAVAVCRASEEYFAADCRIKWVNDIYCRDKKVCGILTESDIAQGWAVLGVGVNLAPLPPDAPEIAGYLSDNPPDGAADGFLNAVLTEFSGIYEKLPQTPFIDEYRSRSYLKAKKLTVRGREAEYVGIDGEFRLLVRCTDGTLQRLDSGEVGIIKLSSN